MDWNWYPTRITRGRVLLNYLLIISVRRNDRKQLHGLLIIIIGDEEQIRFCFTLVQANLVAQDLFVIYSNHCNSIK